MSPAAALINVPIYCAIWVNRKHVESITLFKCCSTVKHGLVQWFVIHMRLVNWHWQQHQLITASSQWWQSVQRQMLLRLRRNEKQFRLVIACHYTITCVFSWSCTLWYSCWWKHVTYRWACPSKSFAMVHRVLLIAEYIRFEDRQAHYCQKRIVSNGDSKSTVTVATLKVCVLHR